LEIKGSKFKRTFKNSLFFIFNYQAMINRWKTLSAEEKYTNRWINVTEYQVINPAGGTGIYGKVHFKNKAVGVIPIDSEGNTWLVGQWRYPLNEWSWEIPEGGSPLNTDVLTSAKRELKEETGITASRWTEIVRTHLSNSVSDEEGFIFLAEDLSFGDREAEETEADMEIRKLPFAEALNMVMQGKITDSLSVMGILMAARLKSI
jgi:8-oxo-dGTP pyrophosphatase MutT (NUDIX family)